ncbi:isochorismatase family protein [Paenibacillus sp. N10]|uniref:Isochorismatase family protein n=1 Tax=Paenibacillus lutrae TaxID=2078573 RepID=A0A7X3K0L7_9BACL|nr:cysteine hydrolase family protein [Paenibacillus lutrae]MVP01374.1 isochorismatase family protein [Paenibacillus lutrae]
MLISSNAVLLLIDVQRAFDHPRYGRRNNPQAEANIARLLDTWRRTGRTVIHIHHIGVSPDSLFREHSEAVLPKQQALPLPGELVLRKSVNSGFIGTDLEERLRHLGCDCVVTAGLTTNHCVETTTRMSGNLGFPTILVSDAAATFDRIGPDGKLYKAEDIHAMTLANLHEEFAVISDTAAVIQAADKTAI